MKNAILHRIYLHGHSQKPLPRWLRRAAARSQMHRAWLSGFNGCFWEAGVRYGPANPYAEHLSRNNAEIDDMMGVDDPIQEPSNP